jgi:hypothetical protein
MYLIVVFLIFIMAVWHGKIFAHELTTHFDDSVKDLQKLTVS